MAKRGRKRGPRRGVELWVVQGGEWVYRKPRRIRDHWRVTRRHRTNGDTETLTLESRTLTDAKAEVVRVAERERRAYENAQKDPEHRAVEDVTVGEGLDGWAQTFDVRPATLAGYMRDVKHYKASLGEHRRLADVTLRDLERLFFGSWSKRAAKTKLKHRMHLVRFWRWAVKHGYARRNVAEDVEVPKRWRTEARVAKQETGQALTLEEARALLDACREAYVVHYEPKNRAKFDGEHTPPEHLWWTVFVALRSGLRLSNIVGSKHKRGLCWGDVDLENEILEIDGERMKNGLKLRVPLHAELAGALRQRVRRMSRPPRRREQVVAVRDNVGTSLEAALNRATLGDRGLRFHDLRHSFVSWLGAHCTHAVMQRLAGHSAETQTDHYARHQDLQVLRCGLNSLPWLREKCGELRKLAGG